MQLEEVNNSTIKNIKGIDRRDSNDKDIMNDPEKIVPNDRMDNVIPCYMGFFTLKQLVFRFIELQCGMPNTLKKTDIHMRLYKHH